MRKIINLKTREGRNRFYQSPEWQAVRIMILSENPYCVECLREGIYELATEVDHIVDIVDDMTLFMDKNNLQGLCKRHHSRKTFKEHKSFQKQSFSVVNKKWKIT